MKIFLYPLIPPLFAFMGLAMFTSLTTAVLMVIILSIIAYVAIRNYDRHHTAEQYDDRRDNEKAIAEYVREVKEKKCGKSGS